MVIGFTLFIISILIIGIWIVIEVKRMKHKIFAFILIGFIILLYASSSFVFHGHDIQWNTVSGVMEASNLYFSWLGSVFTNVKAITGYAIGMDWETYNDTEKDNVFNFLEKDSE